ncbi:hypothetical protein [Shewanella algae]|uniref:hypothetical protein n=1 Tax=Shewanella algae TaxID=38313 RepID=UPI0031F5AF2F
MKEEVSRVFWSLIFTVALVGISVCASNYLNENFCIIKTHITYLQVGSAALVAWAVFGRLYNFESYKGKTLPERLKKAWFIATYSSGFTGALISMQLVAKVHA